MHGDLDNALSIATQTTRLSGQPSFEVMVVQKPAQCSSTVDPSIWDEFSENTILS